MKVNLEDSENTKIYFCGYYQFEPKGVFDKTVLGIDDTCIKFYSDNMPDKKEEDTYFYEVKKRVALANIDKIYMEKIINNKDLKHFFRLNFLMKDIEKSFLFYFNIDEEYFVKKGLKVLKKLKVKIRKGTVDLSLPF